MADVTALLAEADWLQRLARSLVGRDDADDVVQETFAAALHTPPDPDRPARPWLRRVLVNVVRMRHRGRVRRDAREQALDLAEPVRTPEQLLERARVERTLADLVIALAEPLRSTVWLRYREGLSAEEIAAEQQISVATVRRRLSEAVEQLRTEMDARETSTWRAAFAPFLVPRGKPAPIWGLLMAKLGTKIAIIAIAALLLLVGGGVALHQHRQIATTATPQREHQTTIGHPTSKQVFAQPNAAVQQLTGHVTLADKPYSGAKVRVTHAWTHDVLAEVTSGGDGGFTIPNLPAVATVVSASAEGKVATPIAVDLRSTIAASTAFATCATRGRS